MGGYSKSIAVIKGLKEGFSADGGPLTGVIKIERYGRAIRAEVTKINFAPLSEGKYLTGITDGKNTVVFEGDIYEGDAEIDVSCGFASLICFAGGQLSPIASAVSGNYQGEALGIKSYMEKLERAEVATQGGQNEQYEDEAIAEDNYYEYAQADEGGGAVRENTQKEEGGSQALQNEEIACTVQKENGAEREAGLNKKNPLSRGSAFYDKMKNEIEGLLSAYPEESELCALIEGSKWVKINYGDGKYYVFGVIYSGGNPEYLCYGVPAEGGLNPPESMEGLASFLPVNADGDGYWVMYQDADTGASIKIDIE